jgi:putative aldouronate transport system permease protein
MGMVQKAVVAQRSRAVRGAKWRKFLPMYVIMIPCFLYLLIYRYIPMGGLIMVFKDFRIARGLLGSDWSGLKNFERLFAVPNFGQIMRNTVEISLLKLLFGFPAPIILALMLNELRAVAFKRTLQTVLYLPHFISWVVCGTLVFSLFGPSSGAITSICREWFGVELNVMMDPGNFRAMLIWSDVWKEVGWGSIIYLAALASIDVSYYEAAVIDGANKRQQLWYVTMPHLLPIIMTMLLLRVGKIMNAGFEQIYVLQNSLVYDVSEILDTYTYKAAFQRGQYALGAAAGLIKSIIGLVFVVSTNKLAEFFDQEVL